MQVKRYLVLMNGKEVLFEKTLDWVSKQKMGSWWTWSAIAKIESNVSADCIKRGSQPKLEITD